MRSPRGAFEVAIDVLVVAMAVLTVVLVRMAGGGAPRPVWAQATSCGNGFIDPPEQCDPPGSLTCPDPTSPGGAFLPCNGDCTCPGSGPSCGNGVIDAGESCDPPGSFTCPDPTSPGGAFLACNVDCSCPAGCIPTPENSSPACGDTVDNDCDGLIDCVDPDCFNIFPCPTVRKDPTSIKFGRGGPDLLRGHGKLAMAPVSVTTLRVGILLSNLQGAIYSVSLPAGSLTSNAKGTIASYRNPDARTAGGIYNLKIKRNSNGTYTLSFATYGDLSGATTPDMRLQVYIGEDAAAASDGRVFITLEAPWKRTPRGWRAPKDH